MIQQRIHFHRQNLSENAVLHHQFMPERENEHMKLIITPMAFLAVLHGISSFLHAHRIPLFLSQLHDIQLPILRPNDAATSLFLPFQQTETVLERQIDTDRDRDEQCSGSPMRAPKTLLPRNREDERILQSSHGETPPKTKHYSED